MDYLIENSPLLVLILAGAISLPVIITGCDGILEPTAYGDTTPDQFFQTVDDARAAINAVYDPVQDGWSHCEHTFSIPEDDQFRAGDHGEDEAIENLTFDAGNAQLDCGWQERYESINRANGVLANVPDIEMGQELKDRILGEAYFMRAWNYWRFSQLYGGVPLILEEQTENVEFNQPRASLEETRNQVEQDLQQAADLLPLEHATANKGRPTKGSAWGYLTKLYVYQERWSDAIDMGQNVIDGPYPLSPDFEDPFQDQAENVPEVLFGMYYDEGWNTQTHTMYTTPRPWGGWDFHAPTQDLVDEFEDDDPRRDKSIMEPGEDFDLGGDRGPTEYTSDLSPTTGYHFQKWADWRDGGGLNLSMDVPLLRTSDVYLLVAEAEIRSGGNGDDEINTVRQRVDFPMPTVNNATMEDLIHERRVELAGENQRWFDLLRWDKADIVDVKALLAEDRGAYDPPRDFVRPKHYYYAIPQREIDLSGGTLQQNPGYETGSAEACRECVGLQ